MMDSRLLVILAALLGAVGTVIVGLVVWLVLSLLKPKQGKTPTEAAAAAPAEATEVDAEAVTPAEPPEAPHLLSLRHTAEGRWEFYVQGQQANTLEAVPDDAVRKEVVAGLRELVAFARGYVQAHPTPPARVGAGAPTPVPPTSIPDKAATRFPVAPELLRAPAPAAMPVGDLASNISAIIEELKSQVPSLQQRTIRLKSARDGTVQFEVDGTYYNELSDIPDPQARDLIQRATKEWERR